MNDKIKIAVRLDDITPDMDWERFQTFKTLLDKYGIKPLIGIVPDNRDDNLKGTEDITHPEFWSYVKQLQKDGWAIAMHGYRHTYSTKKGGLFPLNNFSEFAGIPYVQQVEMITTGKKILSEKGIITDLFMAPAHSYDVNTLKALKEAGFRGLTDGFGDKPYSWKGLIFYPISFRLKKTLEQKDGFSTLVVHTGTISDVDMPKYENYFKNTNVQWISFSDYLAQEPVNRNAFGRSKEYWMAKGKHLLSQLAMLMKRS